MKNNLNIQETNVNKGAGQRLYKVWKTMGNKEVFNERPVVIGYVMSEDKKEELYKALDYFKQKAGKR